VIAILGLLPGEPILDIAAPARNRLLNRLRPPARAATTADAFNAVAEPRRRQILDALAGGERPVNDLVRLLGLAQPQVSKHLRVLREVGAVDVREEGRQRLYRLNGHALKPIHDWVKDYERSWSERFECTRRGPRSSSSSAGGTRTAAR
jgi:DNA-binding transcriptional ArsR family regulator